MKYPIQKVLIMGLGLHGGGVGAAKFFAKQSKEVIVTDLKLKKELLPSLAKLKQFKNIRYALGKHRIKDFLSANLIIQGAGIPDDSPYLIAARKNHIPIDTD
ncbi:UDP-N-acetylmuramoyl-L-alanine--D-glutamate ligase, partial [Patescibacteria group bacterium]|nr:UDP-N-acetylmuramoyl-L-alanine--D-glutamate ligase [Patescibacteria group bacterium]